MWMRIRIRQTHGWVGSDCNTAGAVFQFHAPGIMARTLAGHKLWKAKPSTYCTQARDKCLPLSKALLNKYLMFLLMPEAWPTPGHAVTWIRGTQHKKWRKTDAKIRTHNYLLIKLAVAAWGEFCMNPLNDCICHLLFSCKTLCFCLALLSARKQHPATFNHTQEKCGLLLYKRRALWKYGMRQS